MAAELDVEVLSRELKKSWSTYLIKHEPAIIAALEDHDRLRATAEKAKERVRDILPAKSELERLDIAAEVYSLLGAALEPRDG